MDLSALCGESLRGGRGAAATPLSIFLFFAACAAPPPPPAPPLPYPPSAKARMLRIAEAEWVEWGSITVAPSDGGRTTGAESAPENFPRVLAYWRAVPEDEGAIALNRRLYAAALAGQAAGAALWHEPAWSAAFISFVLRSAGVDLREFPPSAAHSHYVDALIADAAAFPASAPFLPRAPQDYAPQPGDLLCADRSPRPLRRWQDRAADNGAFRPMHCDIVVAAGPGAVEAIGGNVRDAVTRTRFPADATGRLLPLPPGAPTCFVIFENRLGRLGPWRQAS
ncbi:DUF2272 domain-containing protein [Siccirubricoccus phaeus]|uniref:DUF2272 domain-containing protein n=1 Tax=Siccirubricoccus phaeus TaxID=2595053 RepID=UPI00165C50A1|nr:DUF2272 domain-containing protein [Siccirubricoccus phaeus]